MVPKSSSLPPFLFFLPNHCSAYMNYTLCFKLKIRLWKTDAHLSKKLKEPIEWRIYSQIIHMGLVSRTYEELLQLSSKKEKQPN